MKNFTRIANIIRKEKTYYDHRDKWIAYIKRNRFSYDELETLFDTVGDNITKQYIVNLPEFGYKFHPLAQAITATGKYHRFFVDMPNSKKNYWIEIFEFFAFDYTIDLMDGYVVGCFKDYIDTSFYENKVEVEVRTFSPSSLPFDYSDEIKYLVREDHENLFKEDQSDREEEVDIYKFFKVYIGCKLYDSIDKLLERLKSGQYLYCYQKKITEDIKEFVTTQELPTTYSLYTKEIQDNVVEVFDAIRNDLELRSFYSVV